jgi:cytochrome o ubiquinol oxidase subunit 2
VVSLDWKWLFIYPEQGIATVNELAFPVDTPVNFKITSQSAMNSFFIPALGSQIYSMAGMQTKLHLIANHEGSYDGFSANLSGEGFSDMKFQAIATDEQSFNDWVSQVKANTETLDLNSYPALAAPSKADPVRYYGSVSPILYETILMQYHNGGKYAAGHGDHTGHAGHDAHAGAEMAGMPMNAAEETH